MKPTQWSVALTLEELAYAVEVGRQRDRTHVGSGPVFRPREEAHTVGAPGEMALAKLLGIPWSGRYFDGSVWVERRDSADVGPYEVKTSDHPRCRLWGRPESIKDERVYILAMSDAHVFNFIGWAFGREIRQRGQRKAYRGSGSECFFLDRQLMHPMEELP